MMRDPTHWILFYLAVTGFCLVFMLVLELRARGREPYSKSGGRSESSKDEDTSP